MRHSAAAYGIFAAALALTAFGDQDPLPAKTGGPTVDDAAMRRVYDEVMTPFKYGIVVRGLNKEYVDCPNVFRHGGRWYMVFIALFYNARQKGPAVERIGMAVSRDLVNWRRYGDGPVIDNGPGRGISGDPQIVRMGDLWVMFYFGAFWRPGAFDTFACSNDLVTWTQWTGPDLIAPSEPWDREYAHKPWLLKHDGVVYHFYCAVGDQGRVIALATSKDLRSKGATGSK